MSKYRKKLEELTDARRYSFRGVFKYTGYKMDYINSYGNEIYKPTFMLKNLEVYNEETDKWEYSSDHLWMNYTKNFKYFYPLKEGDIVYFNGRITGYRSRNGYNIKIERPTKVKVVRGEEELKKDEDNVLEDKEMVKIFDEENKEYYEARDNILDALKIPHYYFAMSIYDDIESYLKVGDEWLSQTDYRKNYIEREDVVELYNKVKPLVCKIDYYDSDKKQRVKVSKKEIESAYGSYRDEMDIYDDYRYFY